MLSLHIFKILFPLFIITYFIFLYTSLYLIRNSGIFIDGFS
uniref:Uncharacterized protein n=1 Tax=viral metagenome TaxID=1070528 RepID=A0A6C0AXF7_9ZZZZ